MKQIVSLRVKYAESVGVGALRRGLGLGVRPPMGLFTPSRPAHQLPGHAGTSPRSQGVSNTTKLPRHATVARGRKHDSFNFEVEPADENENEERLLNRYLDVVRGSQVIGELKARKRHERPRDKAKTKGRLRGERKRMERDDDVGCRTTYQESAPASTRLAEPFLDYFVWATKKELAEDRRSEERERQAAEEAREAAGSSSTSVKRQWTFIDRARKPMAQPPRSSAAGTSAALAQDAWGSTAAKSAGNLSSGSLPRPNARELLLQLSQDSQLMLGGTYMDEVLPTSGGSAGRQSAQPPLPPSQAAAAAPADQPAASTAAGRTKAAAAAAASAAATVAADADAAAAKPRAQPKRLDWKSKAPKPVATDASAAGNGVSVPPAKPAAPKQRPAAKKAAGAEATAQDGSTSPAPAASAASKPAAGGKAERQAPAGTSVRRVRQPRRAAAASATASSTEQQQASGNDGRRMQQPSGPDGMALDEFTQRARSVGSSRSGSRGSPS